MSESRVAFLQVLEVASFSAGFKCELQESVAAIAGCACYERGCWFDRATVEFVVGLRVRVGVSRRLREPTCVVAFTGVGLWSTEPVEVGVFARSKKMLVCRVAPLVEHCYTCLWLLSALCWLVVNSGELLSELFSVGSGGSESRCDAFDRVSGRGASQVVSLIVFKFLGCTGGNSCVLVVGWFASFLTPCVLFQMVVWRASWVFSWLCLSWESLPLSCFEVELVAPLVRVVSLWHNRHHSGVCFACTSACALEVLVAIGQPYRWYARLWSWLVSKFSLSLESECVPLCSCVLCLVTGDRVGELPPSFSDILERGGAGELMMEQWSGVVEQGGGGRAVVKAHLGSVLHLP
ncbi:hypothetical protein Taro_055259, partial [Colocasia esculenta]|nr:hypothetical protein [Colocasia esculenta]